MQIQLKDLELHPVEFDQEFPPQSIDLGNELRLRTPLVAKGQAEMLEENHGGKKIVRDIRVRGKFKADVIGQCDRCLTEVERTVAADFDVLQRPQSENTGPEEHEVHESETEIGFYEGDSITLEQVLQEQVILALPVKTLCSEDCKGLCLHCGRNRNSEECQCAAEFEDPRWAALGDIRKKLQN